MTVRSSLARNYHARLDALRAQLVEQARRVYGTLDPADISASFDAIAPDIARFIEAGQGSAAALSAAFINALSEYEVGAPVAVRTAQPGLSETGAPLAMSMAPIAGVILGAIGAGRPVEEAVAYGDYMVARFADSETVRVADETVRDSLSGDHRYVGWEGVVAPRACDACVSANSGMHSPDEPVYRHANCSCQRIPVFEGE